MGANMEIKMTREEALERLEGIGIDIANADMVVVLTNLLSVIMVSIVNGIYREGLEICDRTMPDSWFKSEREN